MILRLRQFEFRFPRPALIMGVVNVTPDSFSDGGRFFSTSAAVAHGLELVRQGADLLDVGGESTRPGAEPVGADEEQRRVIPVIEELARQTGIPVSVDTQKPEVARVAVEAGASLVNDIAANRESDAMWRLVAATGAGYVAMHMQGTPQTMQTNPCYADVTREVREFFEERLDRMRAAGVRDEQIVFDPGIGFGKTARHNLELLRQVKTFTTLERPLLLGVSRKSFLGSMSGGAEVPRRLPAALSCASWAVEQGVDIIRTHDVAETLQAVRMTEALLRRA